MATIEEIEELRDLINEPDDTNGWTDEKLATLLDATLTMNEAASRAWSMKATTVAALVDVSESGSSRKLSDVHKNYLAMAKHFGDLDGGTEPETVSPGPVVHRIRRGFS